MSSRAQKKHNKHNYPGEVPTTFVAVDVIVAVAVAVVVAVAVDVAVAKRRVPELRLL